MGDLLEIADIKTDQPKIQTLEYKKPDSIDLEQLINKLNYINFQGGSLTSVFRHKNYNRSISLDTKPGVCMGSDLSCFWPDRDNLQEEIRNYRLLKIYIDDGISTVVVNPEDVNLDHEGFTVQLPEKNVLKPSRKTRRHSVESIQAQLIQNGVLYRGLLIDFTPDSFRIEIQSKIMHTANTFNPDTSITVTLISNQQIKFSGECLISRTSLEKNAVSYIVKPKYNQIQRFKAREYRSLRQKLVPSPNIVFIHPFTGSRVDLPVYDLSGAGFSVEEDERTSLLLPGMIISLLEIVFSTGMKLTCKCQVLYRNEISGNDHENTFLTGFSIVDMSTYDHTQLLSIIFLADNGNIHLGKDLDPDALWRFLFESGFIYPAKYSHMKDHKEEIKSTYKKMYTNSPDIAQHITYQEKGEILGHVSILRTYENTWLMHHHAASNITNKGAGLYVMEQMSSYAYNANKIESLHMDYLLCYYRPENKFPNRIFGGTAESIDNPKGCSIDKFAFMKFEANPEKFFDDLDIWSLEESNNEDLLNLESCYEEISGGLMLNAMDILPNNSGSISVIKAYEKLQFKREIILYSLKKEGELVAVLIADIADTGLNMSELSNCIKVLILQGDNLPKETLDLSINEIIKKHYNNFGHVLLFPDTYADKNTMEYEKRYNMWIISLDQSDAYFKYLNKLLRFIKK
ncbi:MAG: PilZ domain-containing protein [Spirochaetia bacterium]|jgi:hypothetical protein|nr:PilZ domain-containing protein [Spirochaetia bacterium]